MPRKHALAVRENKNGDVVLTRKVDLFLEEFLRNGGNATEAAMTQFGLTNRSSAAVIGGRYLKQARGLARVYLEKKGATYGKLLDIAIEKATTSKNTEWWDRLMKLAGYEDFMSKGGGVNVNILTAENSKNDFKGFVEEGEIIDGETVEAVTAEEEPEEIEEEPEEEDEIDPTIQALLNGEK